MKYNEFKEQVLSGPEVKMEYDALELEHQIICEKLSARKEMNISQKELADITHIK